MVDRGIKLVLNKEVLGLIVLGGGWFSGEL